MLSERLTTVESGNDVGWLGPSSGFISTTGSLGIGTNNADANESHTLFGNLGSDQYDRRELVSGIPGMAAERLLRRTHYVDDRHTHLSDYVLGNRYRLRSLWTATRQH